MLFRSVSERIKKRLEEFTHALENGDTIRDKFTCRRVVMDLKPMPHDPKSVRKTRKILQASQAVFAMLLGVSVKAVQAWEQGVSKPSKTACRFMDEICRNPKYWLERLEESVVVK